ncbi:MAG: hypothetical protein QOE71_932 [Pseudonocardiales bacterium]|jgi:hypothetical protein|nr:hypothetical protein [Pseudonocardiales bacterium]
MPQRPPRTKPWASRFDPHHPSVRAAARRAGLDVQTYLILKDTETHWPAKYAISGASVRRRRVIPDTDG